jgi:hypothetical protein
MGLPDNIGTTLPWRDVFFLGRESEKGMRDVYWTRIAMSSHGIPMSHTRLINLSDTPRVDESQLVAGSSGIAFVENQGAYTDFHVILTGKAPYQITPVLEDLTSMTPDFIIESTWEWRYFRTSTIFSKILLKWVDKKVQIAGFLEDGKRASMILDTYLWQLQFVNDMISFRGTIYKRTVEKPVVERYVQRARQALKLLTRSLSG